MMPRPWPDTTGNTVLESLSEISRLAEIGMVAGLSDEQSRRFISVVQRMADALPPPETHP